MPEPRLRYRGLVYRAHHPGWAWQPESGEGARLNGGRFNPRGVPALYTSLSARTAWIEAQQGFAFKPQPLTLCAYEVDCTDVLDLTSSPLPAGLGITAAELACPWEDQVHCGVEPPTRRLAERLRAEGIAAIVVPSFAPGAGERDRNLVLWTWSRRRPHRVRVIDDEGRLGGSLEPA